MTSSPSFQPWASFSSLKARCRPAVAEPRKWAWGRPLYSRQACSKATVLNPRPVQPFSRHSRISASTSSTRKVGTKRWMGSLIGLQVQRELDEPPSARVVGARLAEPRVPVQLLRVRVSLQHRAAEALEPDLAGMPDEQGESAPGEATRSLLGGDHQPPPPRHALLGVDAVEDDAADGGAIFLDDEPAVGVRGVE